jgi:DNA-binding transcriptional LysR family regulator
LPALAALDLNLLPILVALHEHGSVSQAAVALGMSQPAVSAALAKLRAHFDDPLFVRAAGGMQATPRTGGLVRSARAILAQIEHDLVPEPDFSPARTTRRISLALSEFGELSLLPRLVARLSQLAPGAALRGLDLPAPQIEAGLASGEIDLAVGHFPDLRKNQFFQQRLFAEGCAGLVRAGHPLAADRLTLRQYLELKHVSVHSSGRAQELIERNLARKHLRRNVVLSMPHFSSVPALIAQSDLIATVPQALADHQARHDGRLLVVKLPAEIAGAVEVRQHWHRKFHYDARIKWLRGLIQSTVQHP